MSFTTVASHFFFLPQRRCRERGSVMENSKLLLFLLVVTIFVSLGTSRPLLKEDDVSFKQFSSSILVTGDPISCPEVAFQLSQTKQASADLKGRGQLGMRLWSDSTLAAVDLQFSMFYTLIDLKRQVELRAAGEWFHWTFYGVIW